MCGILGCFGIVDKNINTLGASIIHRGPNEQKYVEGKDWSVKFNRLSILLLLFLR